MTTDTSVNDLKIDGYTIHQLLGRGGMSSVYLATQESLGRKVAVKVLLEAQNEEFNQRFIREGRIIASLNDPHIITIHDISQLDDGRYYIAMEYVEGGDLTQYTNQKLPPKIALNIALQVAEALRIVHANGIIHRDIKPANILFRKDGSVLLSDFGIAKDLEHTDSDLTQAGASLGSPSYSSPEQSTGKHSDFRTDFYSLGVVLLQLLTGENQYKGNSYTETVVNHFQLDIPQLAKPLDVYQKLLDTLLAKDPTDRPNSAEDICHTLNQHINSLENGTPPAPVIIDDEESPDVKSDITVPPPAFKPRPVTAISAGTLVGFLILTITFFVTRESETEVKIKTLLSQAETLAKAGQLYHPEKDNAATFYKQVLSLDKDNEVARSGLTGVIDQILIKAEQAMANQHFVKPDENSAVHYYQQVLAMDMTNKNAKDGIEAIVSTFLDKAEKQYTRGNLTSPSEQSAYYYFQQVTAIDKTNKEADTGRQKVISSLINRGDKRLTADKLSLPKRDNAVFYYQQVLKVDKNNEGARKGIKRVIERYIVLIKDAHKRSKFAKAHQLINRGLEIAPSDKSLLRLKKEVKKPNALERFLEGF